MEQSKHLVLEITNQCNEKCRHCYHPLEKDKLLFLSDLDLLDSLLKEFGDLGFMFLTITGGEPLLNPYFEQICKIAQKNRFIISIKTNGTLVTENTALFLQTLKPKTVDISIYSADQEEHDFVTKISGSFEKSLNSLKLLKKQGVKISATTPLLFKLKKWKDLYNLFNLLDIPWSCSPNILSSFDQRDEVESFKGTYEDYYDFFQFISQHENQQILSENEHCFGICSGGQKTACIGADFSVRACISFPKNAGTYTVGKGKQLLETARDQLEKRFLLLECEKCDMSIFCAPCPAKIKIENGIGICEQTKKEYAKAYKQFFKSLSK